MRIIINIVFQSRNGMNTSHIPDKHLHVQSVRVGYPLGRKVQEIVHGLSFSLAKGEIGCLLGPSGCGKTTVLRAIAGFESLLDGRIALGGRELSNPAWTA